MNSGITRMIVPFADFAAAHDKVRAEVTSAVLRVMDSGCYLLGSELSSFEEELADWLGVPYVVGVGSGTDALVLAFLALETRRGDEIITTDFTAFSTITAIHQVGAVPVPVDIDLATGLIAPRAIKEALTPRTRGIVPVHLYGRGCDMTAIKDAAETYGLWVVEDCAQSIGTIHAGRLTGTFGTFGAFSFYPTKNLGAYGDAGAIVCQNGDLASRVRALRNYGQLRRDEYSKCGINSRLSEIQAGILRAKLTQLNGWTEKRRALAARYRQALPPEILPASHSNDEHVYHLFPVLVPNRIHFRKRIRAIGVETIVHYPVPVHRQPVMGQLPDKLFPNSIKWSEQVVSLPLHPYLTEESQDFVIRAVTQALSGAIERR